MNPRRSGHETSKWFDQHLHLVGDGVRVLDFACGSGRHAIAAARAGANVTAVDWSAQRLDLARSRAEDAGVSLTFHRADLARDPIAFGQFDLVMVFNYLDRARMAEIVDAVGPNGVLLYETFHDQQPRFGWGPTSPDHLLKPMELPALVRPLTVEFGREVIETIDTRSSALASVLARRVQ